MWRMSSLGRAISLPFGVLHTTHDLGVCRMDSSGVGWTDSSGVTTTAFKYQKTATIQMRRMMPGNNILYDRGSVTRIKRVFLNVDDVYFDWDVFGPISGFEREDKQDDILQQHGWMAPSDHHTRR